MGAIDAACGSVVQKLIDFNNKAQKSVFFLEEFVCILLAFFSVLCPMVRDFDIAIDETTQFSLGDLLA